MKRTTRLFVLGICAVLLLGRAAQAQETKGDARQEPASETLSPETQRGPIEFGFRTFWGDVYGRPDLLFRPDLATSKLNEYSDIRKNFYIRRANITFDDVLGTRNYVNYQTQSTFFNNQSHLGTFGQYSKFKAQFRYDEIPHIYTNTARTLYTQTQPGVYTVPLIIRQGLQAASSTGTAAQISNNLRSFVATQVGPSEHLIVPQIQRRAGTGLFSYDVTPDWNLAFSFRREHEKGTRPIGAILNPSPSAAASSQPGTTADRQSPSSGVELPEPIDYFFNTVRGTTEYWKSKWAVQFGYNGSFFNTDVKSLRFDAPFATADIPVQIIPPGGGCTPAAPAVNCAFSSVPSHGVMAPYPDNHANYLNFAGAFDAGRHLRVMGSTSNGWLRQNDAFLPYTANNAIIGLSPLPAASLNGRKQTLAMNWTAVSKLTKNVQLEAKYRHYDYNNNTRTMALTPLESD